MPRVLVRKRATGGGPPPVAPPVNTVAPAVTGTATVGQLLSTTDGTWTGSPTSYTYQWQRDGVDIGGATANTYTLVDADYTHAVRCVVTAHNAGGDTAANSNATAAVVRTYAQQVLADSPTAYYKLNEPSGTTATDTVAGNNGTYHNATLGVAGPVVGNTAVKFTAASPTTVTVPDAAALDLGDGPLTIEFWLKVASASEGLVFLMDKSNDAYALYITPNASTFTLQKRGIAGIYTVTNAAFADTTSWHHVVITKNGATSTAYVDAVSQTLGGFANQTLADTAVQLKIGDVDVAGFPINDSLGQIAFYKSVLSSARVSAHYAARNV